MRPEVLVVLALGACAEIDLRVPGPCGADQCAGEGDAASLIQLRQSNVTERVEDEPAAAAMVQQQDETHGCPFTPISDVVAAPSWKALAGAKMLRSHHDERCLEREIPSSANNNRKEVFIRDCDPEKATQFWLLKDNGELKSAWAEDVKGNGEWCADYHTGNNDVYMHPCHGGNNQKWYFGGPEGNELKSKHDNHCVDYHLDQHNAYMHSCHGGNNQKWSFAAAITKTTNSGKVRKNGQVNWMRRRRRRTKKSDGTVGNGSCGLKPVRP